MPSYLFFTGVTLISILCSAWAGAEDPRHAELRQLRDSVFQAYEARDIDGLLKHVHDDVIVTWQNAEQNHGKAELRGFYDRMMQGDAPVVTDVKSELVVHPAGNALRTQYSHSLWHIKGSVQAAKRLEFQPRKPMVSHLGKGKRPVEDCKFSCVEQHVRQSLLSAAQNSFWVSGGVGRWCRINPWYPARQAT